jgi:hypothetical protein
MESETGLLKKKLIEREERNTVTENEPEDH